MNIKELRELHGWHNQDDLAAEAGISQASMSRVENLSDSVTLRNLRKVAKAMNVPLADLFATDRTVREAALIKAYRELPEDRRAGWDDIVNGVLAQRGQSAPEQSETPDPSKSRPS